MISIFASPRNSGAYAVVHHLSCHHHLRYAFRPFVSYTLDSSLSTLRVSSCLVPSLTLLCFYILYLLPLSLTTSVVILTHKTTP